MIKEFIKRVTVGGEIDKFLLQYEDGINFVRCKDPNGIILVYVSSPKVLVEETFAIRKATDLLKIIDSQTFDDNFANETEKILFSGQRRKLYWPKTGKSHVQDDTLSKDKSEMMKIFTDGRIVVKLDKETVNEMVDGIGTGLGSIAEFKIVNKELVLAVKGTDEREYRTMITNIEGEKFVENQYNAKPLLKVLQSLDFECRMTIEFGMYGGSEKPLPLVIEGKAESGIDVTYILIPIRKSL